jgi:hypothetical protein
MEFLILFLAIGAFVALIVWAIKYGKKVNARKVVYYQEFANKHRLQHSTHKHFFNVLNSVNGTLHDCTFQFYEEVQGSGKHQQFYAHIKFYNTPFNFDFKIGKEHLFSKAGKLFGMKDVEMGDDAFDKRFLLKSKSENELRDLMTYDIQGELTRLDPDLKGSIHCKDGVLVYTIIGGLPKETSFRSAEKVVDFMIELIKKDGKRQ